MNVSCEAQHTQHGEEREKNGDATQPGDRLNLALSEQVRCVRTKFARALPDDQKAKRGGENSGYRADRIKC